MTLRNLVGALFWFSMLLVCWILLAQQADLPPLRIWDKAAHTLAFAALMLLSAVAYRPRLKLQWIALLLLGFGFVAGPGRLGWVDPDWLLGDHMVVQNPEVIRVLSIKQAKLESPSSGGGVFGQMFLEIAFFRSLLRNTRSQLLGDGRVVYATSIGLWLAAVAFHWSLLVILVPIFKPR